MLTIGSWAIKNQVSSYSKEPKDIDYISSMQEYMNCVEFFKAKQILNKAYPASGDCMVIKLIPGDHKFPLIQEFNIAYENSTNAMILEYCKGQDNAPLDVLLMLKLSHRYKKNSPHFIKTMRDIQYLRNLGVELNSVLTNILKLREKETYNYAHPNLMQNKNHFFVNDESFYVYDHDDIHKAVAITHQPAYMYFKPEDSEVMVSKKMWNECDHYIKLLAGLEESMVLAIERSLMPHPGILTPKQAFDVALMKVCTSITSGWFREFCWENYDAIQNLYDESFVDKFNKAVSENKIKPFKSNDL